MNAFLFGVAIAALILAHLTRNWRPGSDAVLIGLLFMTLWLLVAGS